MCAGGGRAGRPTHAGAVADAPERADPRREVQRLAPAVAQVVGVREARVQVARVVQRSRAVRARPGPRGRRDAGVRPTTVDGVGHAVERAQPLGLLLGPVEDEQDGVAALGELADRRRRSSAGSPGSSGRRGSAAAGRARAPGDGAPQPRAGSRPAPGRGAPTRAAGARAAACVASGAVRAGYGADGCDRASRVTAAPGARASIAY